MNPKKLIGHKCYLSPISQNDAEMFHLWINDIDIAMHTGIFTKILTLKDEQEAINFLSDTTKGNYVLSIRNKQNDNLIGNCGLRKVDLINKNAEFGIFIGNKKEHNKGFGKEATNLILDFGFNALNLHNIWLRCYSYNKKAYNIYKKIGFREIGRMREAKIIGNKKYDVIYMDLLQNEFKNSYISKNFFK